MPHILSGHTYGGGRGGPNKDRFPKWMTAPVIEKAVREAYRHGVKLTKQGGRVLVVGYSQQYKIVIKMWLNLSSKTIESAWPLWP